MVLMASVSLIAGIIGYFVARGGVKLFGWLASEVPVEKHNAFLADLWAHLASYGTGFLGGLFVCAWVLVRRAQMAKEAGRGQPIIGR